MKDVIDYIVKNKYVLLCILIVVLLYAFGIIRFLTNILIFFSLIFFAIFVGKKLQDGNRSLKDIFNFKNFFDNFRKEKVYYYKEPKNKK